VSLSDDSLGRAAAWLWSLVRGLGDTPIMTWVANLIRALWSVIEAFLMMFVKTATVILPPPPA
jgi:hypothetical protein